MKAEDPDKQQIADQEAWFDSVCTELEVPNLGPLRHRTCIAVREAWFSRQRDVVVSEAAVAAVADRVREAVVQASDRRPAARRHWRLAVWASSMAAAAAAIILVFVAPSETDVARAGGSMLDAFEASTSAPLDDAYAWLDEDITALELDYGSWRDDIAPAGDTYNDILDDIDDFVVDDIGFDDWS